MKGPETLPARFAGVAKKLNRLSAMPATAPMTATDAGEVLILAGDALRRKNVLGESAAKALLTKMALTEIGRATAKTFALSIDVKAERKRLEQTLNDAFEVMVADDDDRKEWSTDLEKAVIEGLSRRDQLASLETALGEMKLADLDFSERIREIDSGLMSKTRMLVAFNDVRRSELEVLDNEVRESAWWYSSRATCDSLKLQYQTGSRPTAHNGASKSHLENCDACKRDTQAAQAAHVPSHIDAHSLERRDSGSASRAEMAWMDAHSKGCRDCKRAMEALSIAVE